MENQDKKEELTKEVKQASSLEIFFNSLEDREKELLSSYINKKSYECLSDNFNKLLKDNT